MIDAATTWQQACTALAGGEYDAAFDILEQARREAPRPLRAQLALWRGSVHALYGDPAVTEMAEALRDARTADPAVREAPLYRALSAELDARTRGPEAAPPGPDLREAPDALVRYHALCALAVAERHQEALDLHLPVAELPEHLRWRVRSWQADAQEQLGQSAQATLLYAEAAHLARGLDRAVMLQEQAALLLSQGQPQEAKAALDQARLLYPARPAAALAPAGLAPGGPDPSGLVPGDLRLGAGHADQEDEALNLATWHYLRAQALLGLGQPEAAHEMIREADRLERAHGDPSYGVALVRGQVLTHLGQPEEALSAFEQTLALAGEGDRPYAHHELGVALLDLDRPVEAREKLEAVLAEPDYPYQPEVLADIAECDYRLGRLQEAQTVAEQALAQGAVVPASLVLGNVALDYFQLDEALEHYERVIREAAPESRDWVTGHQMAADVLAQQGFRDPAAVYAHAQQALAHTPESDDWFVTLQDHLGKAQAMLGQQPGRLLN